MIQSKKLHKNQVILLKHIRIALLQITAGADLAQSLQKGRAACRAAKARGADIALFPEMWSCGYTFPEDAAAIQKLAIPADGDFVKAFGALAAELQMAVGITLLERHSPAPRNTLCLFDRFGRRVLTYAKVHTCDFGDERVLDAGDDFYVTELDTAAGPVKVGAMICYDREFPESARILMLKGAELILVPNACPMEINRLSQLRGRAYENMVGIATCNDPDAQPDCNGHSSVFDGIAYRPEGWSSRDMEIFEADGKEGVFVVEFPLEELRDYRAREVHGNAYRRPEKYGLLVQQKIEPPFVRADRRA